MSENRRFLLPPGYTQVPNEIFEELLQEASLAELRVTMMIVRRTFGFGHKDRLLTNAELCHLCNLSRQSVTDGLKAGEKRGYIGKRNLGGNRWAYGIRVKNPDSQMPSQLPKDQDVDSLENRKSSNKEKQTPTGVKQKDGADAPASVKKASKPKPRDTFKPNEEDPVDLAIVEVFEHWAKGTGDEGARLTQHRASKIRARLREKAKGHSSDEKEVALAEAKAALLFAVDGMVNSKWHHDNGQLDFMLMFRDEERITFFTNKRKAQVGQQQSTPSGNGDFADYGRVVERG